MIIAYSRANNAAALAGDPHWASTVLLMGFETGVIDESLSAHGTATGSATASAIKHKYGSKSLACLGNSIRYVDHSDWDFGSGNFTIEAFINISGDNDGTTHFVVSKWFSTGTLSWKFWVNSSHQLAWSVSTDGSTVLDDITASSTLSFNTWYHVCIDYDGTKYRLYVNGVMVGSSTTARTIFHSSSTNLGIGANSNSGLGWLDGYQDELRITKGIARYASDSGFSVPSNAFPRIPAWMDTASITPTGEGSDYNGYTIRQVFPGSMLSTSGSIVRLALQAGSSFGFTIDGLYIGEQAASGDPYDMKASSPAPAQLTVGGSTTITVAANAKASTDLLKFAIDETKTYVISAHFSASSTLATANGTSVAAYQKAAASEAATADVTGYTARPAGQALFVIGMQVSGP